MAEGFHGAQEDVSGTFPKLGEPQYRPQYIIVLIMGTSKKVPLILGNPHLDAYDMGRFGFTQHVRLTFR